MSDADKFAWQKLPELMRKKGERIWNELQDETLGARILWSRFVAEWRQWMEDLWDDNDSLNRPLTQQEASV